MQFTLSLLQNWQIVVDSLRHKIWTKFDKPEIWWLEFHEHIATVRIVIGKKKSCIFKLLGLLQHNFTNSIIYITVHLSVNSKAKGHISNLWVYIERLLGWVLVVEQVNIYTFFMLQGSPVFKNVINQVLYIKSNQYKKKRCWNKFIIISLYSS